MSPYFSRRFAFLAVARVLFVVFGRFVVGCLTAAQAAACFIQAPATVPFRYFAYDIRLKFIGVCGIICRRINYRGEFYESIRRNAI